jgi:zinc protease
VTRAISLLALWALAAPARPAPPPASRGAAATPAPLREELEGGLELIVLPIRGARTTSLRYVVRAGSAHDPPGREGLAHLLEHLLAQGRDFSLRPEVQRQGGLLNAFTYRDSTRYVLDAPAAAFPDLAGRLLRSITDPRLDPADLAREQAVIAREDVYGDRGPGLFSLLEEALFPAPEKDAGPIGTAEARAGIRRDDLVRFFQESYSTRNTTVILVGAIEPDEARALVERNVLLPPGLPSERLPRRDAKPTLPTTSSVRAGFLAATLGYAVAPEDEPACEPLAELVGLRLLDALRRREALVRDLSVECLLLRGTPFLVATAYGQSIEATDLPERMDRVLAQAATRPADGRERSLLAQRLARRAEREARDPTAQAERLAQAAAHPLAAGLAAGADPRRISPRAMQAAARRAFRRSGRAVVFLSPFEGKTFGDEPEDAGGE